jgi:putative ABC transport system permease protein
MGQLITESLLLSIAGGLLGLFVARSLLDLFRRYTPPQYAVDVVMDPRVLLLTGILCVVVGLAIGVAPALRATRKDLLAALPGSNLGITRRGPSRLRHWVVIPQIGLSLVLLLAAGFHIRSLMKIELADLGYDPAHVSVINVIIRSTSGDRADKPRPPDYAEKAAERSRTFYRRVIAAINAVPSTGGAAMVSTLPVTSRNPSAWNAVSYDAFLAGDDGGIPTARASVSPGYFRTMGISLTEGRDFDDRDSRTSAKVAVVSASLAERLWPGRSALGRLVGSKNNFPARGEAVEWLEVVGVVDDVDPIVRERGSIPQIYLTLNQEWRPTAGSVVARIPRDAVAVLQALKQAILGADALAEIYRVQTMEQIIAGILYPRRLAAAILGVSGLIGMFLAGLGLYGVIAYSVAQRVQEIGIRTALGADRRDVEWLVVREGARILVMGSIAGLALTYAALRLTARFVTLPEMDAGTWIVVPAILAAVTLLACYLPARRAARLDPLVALRQL